MAKANYLRRRYQREQKNKEVRELKEENKVLERVVEESKTSYRVEQDRANQLEQQVQDMQKQVDELLRAQTDTERERDGWKKFAEMATKIAVDLTAEVTDARQTSLTILKALLNSLKF